MIDDSVELIEPSSHERTDNYFFSNKNDTRKPFDIDFIKSNFCPLKFSKSDIKNLSSDFIDQTLGGHRVYREELIKGRIAKVYEYKVKIIKYDSECVNVEKVSTNESSPVVIVENNLIIPLNTETLRQSPITISPYKIQGTSETGVVLQARRGRPRKYPIGEEPYKKKKGFNCLQNNIPQTEHQETKKRAFTFSRDMQLESPKSMEQFDFQKYQNIFEDTNTNVGPDKEKVDNFFKETGENCEMKKNLDDEILKDWRERFAKEYF